MQFQNASEIESVCAQMKLAEYRRGLNRSKINDLLNGNPPYSEDEVRDNGIVVNHNDLRAPKIVQEARQQMTSAILKPGRFFAATTDWGAVHNRQKYCATVTKEANRPMKNSRVYYETQRSKFAMLLNSGIAPVTWENKDRCLPTATGVEDVLLPSNTLLTMENLPFYAVHKSFTLPQLKRLTRGQRNPGWNMKLVKNIEKWVDTEATTLMGGNWPEVWAPEKQGERIKSDGGLYAADNVPTIECFDFYFWNDSDDVEGWNRRIILDAWGTPGIDGSMKRETDIEDKGEFLFNPGKRKYAESLDQLIAFQFADLSAVAPFRYHSVRSLGWMLYGICHLQNRLHCKFNEAVFENLMMYLRVKSLDDAERALKIEFINRGIIDESVQFLRTEERWNPNENLVQMGLAHNSALIESNTSSWRQRQADPQQEVEKTKFQVMAEVNASTMLISAALSQAYTYQKFEYVEDFRRMMRKNSNDPAARTFRNNCLKAGVPEKLLVPEAWEVEPERVMGAGNKTQAMAEASQLMQFRPLYDPEPQRKILRSVTLAITDDPAQAEELVPEAPQVSNTIHDSELVFSALMSGNNITPKSGVNALEVIAVMLRAMQAKIQEIMQSGGVGTPADVKGLSLCYQYTTGYIQQLAQDPEQKDKVTAASKQLGKLMNEVKGMAQRQQQAAEKAAQQNGNGQDAELQAKIKAIGITAQAKAASGKESHALKTAQKMVTYEQKQSQDEQKHKVEMRRKAQEHKLEMMKGAQEHKLAVAGTRLGLMADAAKAKLDITKEHKKQTMKPKTVTE